MWVNCPLPLPPQPAVMEMGRSGLAALEYGGGTMVFCSLAVHMKLELSESTVLVADNEPTGRTI